MFMNRNKATFNGLQPIFPLYWLPSSTLLAHEGSKDAVLQVKKEWPKILVGKAGVTYATYCNIVLVKFYIMQNVFQ